MGKLAPGRAGSKGKLELRKSRYNGRAGTKIVLLL